MPAFFAAALNAALRQHEQIKRDIERLAAETPEVLIGLIGLYNGEEDYTCLTLKKLAGRRERGFPARESL
jgi:hypothetical protein